MNFRQRFNRFFQLAFVAGFILLFGNCDVLAPGLGESVDIEEPKVAVESHNNGEYVGGTFSLSGSVTDDIGVATVTVSNGDNSIEATLDGETWTTNIDSSLISDGDLEFLVTVTDLTEKTSTVKILLTVDNNSPTVMVTTPSAYGSSVEFNKTVSIKGEAADTTRVQAVYISILDSSDDSLIIDQAIATGTSSWYYSFDSTTFSDGEYYLFVEAEDYSGNMSSYFYHFNDILTSASDPGDLPNIEEINGADYQGLPLATGLLTDDLSDLRKNMIDGSQVVISFNQYSDKPSFTYVSPTDSSDPADNILASPQRFSGFAEDDDGVDFSTVFLAIWNFADNPSVDTPVVDWVAPTFSGTQWSYETNLSDGEYQVKVIGDDIYGASLTAAEVTTPPAFKVSSFAPVLTITNPAQGSYAGSDSILAIEVGVTGMGSGTVEIDPDGDDDYSNALAMTDPDLDGTYTITMTAGVDFTPIDGSMLFKVRGGTAGNYGTNALQLSGDITSPSISATYPGDSDVVNGSFSITGSASDENQVDQVYLWIEDDLDGSTTPPGDFTTWYTPSTTNVYNWVYTLDSVNDLLNGSVFEIADIQDRAHTLHFIAVDGAGNDSGVHTLSFSVDQSSDLPVFNLSNAVEGGTTVDNGFGQNGSIIGLVEDDDSIDVDSLEILIDLYNDDDFSGVDLGLGTAGVTSGTNEEEDWIPVSNKPVSDSRIISWSHELLSVPEGIHSFQVRASDNTASVKTTTIMETEFMIDAGPPTLLVTSPSSGSVFNADFMIEGTAVDANGVSSIVISEDGGSSWSDMDEISVDGGTVWDPPADASAPDLPLSAGDATVVNWRYGFSVNAAGLTDGDYSIQVKAVDNSGGSSYKDFQLVVDATGPSVDIDTPASGSSVNGTSVLVRGTSDDNRSISDVRYYITDDVTAPSTVWADWTSVTGQYSWNFTFDSTLINSSAVSADQRLWIIALDGAGNYSDDLSSPVTFQAITIDQTSDRPVIDFNDIDKTETNSANNVLVGSTTLTGSIFDDDGVDLTSLEISFNGGAWNPLSDPPGADESIWRHDISSTGEDLGEGEHYVKIRARDTESDSTVGDGSDAAVYTTNFNWNIADNSDPVAESRGVPFILNIGPPSIAISEPVNFSYHDTDITISGSSADANGVKYIDISYDNRTSWTRLVDNSSPYPSPQAWSATYTVTGSNDGSVSYIIRATDALDSTGFEYGWFTVDATDPTSIIENPGDADVVNGDLTFYGTATDVNLDTVYYHIGLTANPAPSFNVADGGEYSALVGNYSWADIFDTTAQADGNYTLRIIPTDKSENVGLTNSIDFAISQASDKPVISYSTLNDVGTFTENLLPPSKQISGTVEDDDNVDASTVQYKLFAEDGTTVVQDWTNVLNQPGSDSRLVIWSHTFDGTVTDGRHQMQIRSSDTNDAGAFDGVYDWAESVIVPFAVDTANPVTTFGSVNGGATNSDVIISGSATDGNSVTDVDISFDSGSTWDPADNFTVGSVAPWDYTYSVDTAGHTDDGVLSYKVRLIDEYDKEQVYDRYITIDTTPATTDISQPTLSEIVNGEITLRGSSDDTGSGVDEIYYSVGLTASGEPGYPGDYSLASGSYSWSSSYNTSAIAGPLSYTLWIRSLDVAGNLSVATSLVFSIDQSSDKPVINYSTLNDAGTFADNLLPLAKQISGTIEDDDSVDASTVQYKLFAEDGTTIVQNWTAVSDQPGSDSGFVTWSQTFGGTVTDGKYQVQIRSADVNDAGAFDGLYDWTETVLVPFAVDTANPTTDFNAANGGATNADVVISGTASDANGITDVDISFDSGTTWLPADTFTPGTSEPWSYTYGVDTATHTDDGLLTYQVRITDEYDKEQAYDRYITVDTTASTITISQPGSGESVNGLITLRGSSDDTGSGVDEVYYSVDLTASGVQTFPDDYTLASGSYNWSATNDTSAITGPTSYTLWVVATDLAGNESTASSLVFSIDQSSDKPVISYSTLNDSGTFADNLLPLSKQISGTIEDDDNVDASTVQYKLFAEDGTTIVQNWTDVSDQPGSDSGFVTWSHTFDGGVTDGKHQVQIRAADINDAGAYNGLFDWTETGIVPFAVDTSNPVTTFDTTNGGATNTNLVISGTASDANGVTNVDISFDNGTTWLPADTFTPGTSETWDYTHTVDTATHTDDGLLTYKVRITDEYTKEQAYDRYITIDTTPATLVINQPSTGATVNGLITLRGTSDDTGAGVDEVYYSVQTTASGTPTFPGDYSLASGNYNWSNSYDTSLIIGPTAYTIWVVAKDLAANTSTAVSLNFTVDQSSDIPVVEFSSITEGGTYGDNELPLSKKISGTLEDDDGVDVSTIQYRLYEEDGTTEISSGWTAISDLPASDATFASWTHTLDGSVTDGKYQIQFRASDTNDAGAFDGSFDWVATGLQQITLDTTFPSGSIATLDISSPYDATVDTQAASSGMLIYNSFDLIGTATDGNGVTSVTFSTDGTTFSAVDSFSEPDWTHTVPITRGGGMDGSLTLYIRIEDTVGKVSDKTLNITVDTVEPMAIWDYNNELLKQAGVTTLSGTNSKVIGSVEDTGSISNVDSMGVFFVKGTDFYSPRAAVNTATSGNAVPTDSSYIISVDNRFEIDDDGEAPGDGDGFLEGLRSKGSYDEWYTYLDSTILPDGPLEVHFASYDGSGNRSIGTETIQISNEPPAIDSLTISSTNYIANDVRVKVDGIIDIVMNVSDAGTSAGIDDTSFELEVIEQYTVLSGDVGSLQTSFDSANTYLYDYTDFTAVDTSTGTYSFDTSGFTDGFYYRIQTRIYDVSANVVTKDFYMWVYDSANDSTAPTITIDELTQDNVGSVGHIEEAVNSPDADSEADVSGTIILSGTVYDDSQSPSVTVEVDDGSGWAIVGTAGTSNETGDLQTGFTYDWTYTWDSSSISGVAATGVAIRAYGTDAKPNSTLEGNRPVLTVDVVPYITELRNGFDAGLLQYGQRSALGIYPVATGSTIELEGYNLYDGAGTNSVTVDVDSFTPTGDAITLFVDLSTGTDASGLVSVVVNGVISRNNGNTNILSQNQESHLFNEDLTDDRELVFWDIRSHSSLTNKTEPSMGLNSGGTGVDWLYAEGGNYLMYTNGALNGNAYMTDGFAIQGGDFAYNSNGSIMWLYLHNSTWTTLTEWGWFGSVQWGRDVTTTRVEGSTEAYNWNMSARPTLGVGNMSFENDTDFATPVFNVTAQDSMLTRYKDLKLRLSGGDAATVNHVTYRDVSTSARGLVYYAFQTGTSVGGGTALDTGWTSDLSKGVNTTNAYKGTGNDSQKQTGVKTPMDHRGTITTDNAEYYDIQITTGGVAVAAWYDSSTTSLKLAYNIAPTSDADTWIERGTAIATSGGSHVAMDIDPDGGIHLAYLDGSTGFMKYSYLPAYDTANVNIKTVLVDGLLSNGQFNDITVRDFGTSDYRPVISTFSSSFSGTMGSVRTAWPVTAVSSVGDGTDGDGLYTGSWEVMFVPASVVPAAESTFVELLIDGDDFTIGYNGTNLEEATYLGF